MICGSIWLINMKKPEAKSEILEAMIDGFERENLWDALKSRSLRQHGIHAVGPSDIYPTPWYTKRHDGSPSAAVIAANNAVVVDSMCKFDAELVLKEVNE